MDGLEKATQDFLANLSIGEVLYEPGGRGTAPDFSVGGRIAVEVTRLVKTSVVGGVRINATERHPRTIQSLRNAIERVGRGPFTESSFVGLWIEEPIDVSEARRSLAAFLEQFARSGRSEHPVTNLCAGLKIDIEPAFSKKDTRFRLGAISGRDFVGWVGPDLVDQCADAIERKRSVLSRLSGSFAEIWLAVGSNLTLGNMEEYLPVLHDRLALPTKVTQLLLVNRLHPEHSTLCPFLD